MGVWKYSETENLCINQEQPAEKRESLSVFKDNGKISTEVIRDKISSAKLWTSKA